jgi:hypothetical protein
MFWFEGLAIGGRDHDPRRAGKRPVRTVSVGQMANWTYSSLPICPNMSSSQVVQIFFKSHIFSKKSENAAFGLKGNLMPKSLILRRFSMISGR